ncbi:MAG: mannitol-1-phosphate 5-dehydrogenase [Lachnospiraceae bacterium]|jgi:mannitol-1-phosphate 5-dehydrogenase|nr:mannitol-1-phosphate 5-dehydrogenase [Lachnospiraceae bacterium]
MKTAIQFGAGNIGRGFIGMLLAQAGYRVIFADVSEVIIDRLAADQKYTVHVMDTEVEDVEITNITGIMSNGEAIIDEIAKADILTTAVGLRVLGFIAPTIAKGIQKRIADGSTEPMNIIACENAIRATSQLKEHVYGILSEEEKAYCEKYVGFADCSVDRIVPPVRSENPVDVVVEKYCEWNVEKASLKGEIPEIPGMNLADNLMAYIQRKLFTLNTGHCITAYTGILAGHKTIDQAISDPKIYDLVKAAMTQSGDGLIQRFGFDKEAHYKYIDKIINRFKNPYLKDDVTRVGREPLRKLSADDRLVSPLTTAMSYGLPVDKLVLGIGAALRYNNPEDAQSAELQEKIAAKGVAAAFSEISGVTDAALLEQVTKSYETVTELFQ